MIGVHHVIFAAERTSKCGTLSTGGFTTVDNGEQAWRRRLTTLPLHVVVQ